MHTIRNLFIVALIPLFSGCSQIPGYRQQGLLTQGDRRPVFTSCDGTERYILLASRYEEKTLEKIESHLQKSGVLFADLYGHLKGWKRGVFDMTSAERVESSPQGCSEPDLARTERHAFGHEPEWNLRIIDDRIIIERTGEAPIDVPYSDRNAEANGETIKLSFIGETCVDSPTGDIYADTVQLRIGDKVMQGCSYSRGGHRSPRP